MQPSDRQSPGEVEEQRREDTIEPASQPLYEFPGGEPSLYIAPPPASFAPPLPPPTPVKRSRVWIWIVVTFFASSSCRLWRLYLGILRRSWPYYSANQWRYGCN